MNIQELIAINTALIAKCEMYEREIVRLKNGLHVEYRKDTALERAENEVKSCHENIKQLLQQFAFELFNESTKAKIKNEIDVYLHGKMCSRHVKQFQTSWNYSSCTNAALQVELQIPGCPKTFGFSVSFTN